MTLLRIYDYTHTLKDSYFIYTKYKVVLVNLDSNYITVSSLRLMLFFQLMRGWQKEIPANDPLYDKVLNRYKGMLQELVPAFEPHPEALEG